MNKKTVIIGMSGGVDSSVAAYLLKQQGYHVIGVTMQTWETAENHAEIDAKKVASTLEIPYHVINFKQEFEKNVIDYFITEYQQGRTPNPCIVCNRYVKWEALLQFKKQVGADLIATGHYAQIEKHPETKRYTLKTSITSAKDQTYALYNLTQEQLQNTLMPVGAYHKEEIRKIAEEIGIHVSQKADSQEICFIPDNDYSNFIEQKTGKYPSGNFVDLDGNLLAKHNGIIHYTVGQRKGLGVSFGKPMYVYGINVEKNEVILCENDALFQKTLYAKRLNFVGIENIGHEMRFQAKIRYNHKKAWCTVRMKDKLLECIFDEPQRAITPGQALVLYDGDYVACGGTII